MLAAKRTAVSQQTVESVARNEKLYTYVRETKSKNDEAMKCIKKLQAQLAAVGGGNANEGCQPSVDDEAPEDENQQLQERLDTIEDSGENQSSSLGQTVESEAISKSPPQTLQDMLDLYPHEE